MMNKSYKLYELLKRYILVTIIIVTLFSAVGFGWLSYLARQNDRSLLSNQINTALAHIITPSLDIADTMSVNRTLGLLSDPSHFIAVVDQKNNILLANYSNISAVRKILLNPSPQSCSQIKRGTILIRNSQYYVSCLSLYDNKRNFLGVMLNFAQYDVIPFSREIILYSLLLLFIALSSTVIILRNIMRKQFLMPIQTLHQAIRTNMLNPLLAKFEEGKLSTSTCEEIAAIQQSFYDLIKNLQNASIKNTEMERQLALSHFARQVAHDLNNYLYQLNYRISTLTSWSETDREAILGLVGEMNMISKRLLDKYRITRHPGPTPHSESTDSSGSKLESKGFVESQSGLASESGPELEPQLGCLAEPLLHVSILSQLSKLQQILEIQCHSKNLHLKVSGLDDLVGDFIKIHPTEFRRILLNIMNNAIEAESASKTIFLRFIRQNSSVLIEIEDDGCGIPSHILEKLGSEEITYGKKNGNGIGIYHASRILKDFGGSLHIDSQVGRGTVVRMTLPLSQPPLWHIASLGLKNIKTIVIIDDNPAIHESWALRLKDFPHISLRHFDSFFKATTSTESLPLHETLYLVDYQIQKEYVNGIDFISSQGLVKQAILVTGHSESPEVITACTLYRLYMLPKEEIPCVTLDTESLFNPWSDQ